MKKTNTAILLSIVLLFIPGLAEAVDLELRGGAGNNAFDDARTSPLGDTAEAFEPQSFPLIKAEVSGDVADTFIYYAGFERDSILRNRVYANMGYRLSFLTLEMGPFVGIANGNESIVTPGASMGLNVQFPGIVFLNFKASSTLGGLLEDAGDYVQSTMNLSAGFWVPHVVCSANIETKEHTALGKFGNVLEDAAARYFFRAQVYTKNVPYTIQVDLGYQSLTRSYSDYSVVNKNTKTDEFKTFFLGLEASYTIFSGFRVVLGGEMPLYAWSSGDMTDPKKNTFLYQFHGGIIWTLPF